MVQLASFAIVFWYIVWPIVGLILIAIAKLVTWRSNRRAIKAFNAGLSRVIAPTPMTRSRALTIYALIVIALISAAAILNHEIKENELDHNKCLSDVSRIRQMPAREISDSDYDKMLEGCDSKK